MADRVSVAGLFVYPLKSARAVALENVEITPRGPAGDRLWMVVDANGKFLTQRQNARLSQVTARTDGDLNLALEAPGMLHVRIDAKAVRDQNRRLDVEVWKDICSAFDAGDEVADWLACFLGVPCRLAGQLDDFMRRVVPEYSPQGDPVSFADGFPLLLTTMPSLAALRPSFAVDVPMERFRPNIVLDGNLPFEEDVWQTIRIGKVVFNVVKPCSRCVITTIDQASGEKPSKEPIETLARLRRGKKGVYFGQNLMIGEPGTIRLGDAVEVVSTTDPHAELEGVNVGYKLHTSIDISKRHH